MQQIHTYPTGGLGGRTVKLRQINKYENEYKNKEKDF